MAARRKLPPVEQLYREYEATESVQGLAEHYGVTRVAIYEALREAGYDTRVHKPGLGSACPFSDEELLTLYDEIGGIGIARDTGFSTAVVYKWLTRAGYIPKQQRRR